MGLTNLSLVGGSCETPIGGLAELQGDTLRLRGEILRIDGSQSLSDEVSGPISEGPALGQALAKTLLDRAGGRFF